MSEKDKTSKSLHPMKLIVIVLLWLFAFYVALLILSNPKDSLESSRPSVPSLKHRGVCRSPECITLAHQLHNWRDVSIDPCQDFFKAVCGKYNEHTLVEGSRFTKKGQIIINLLDEFLHENEPSDSISENAMKLFYGKCKNEKMRNQTEVSLGNSKEILRMIQKIGSWPLFDKNWDESKFDLNDFLSNLASIGVIGLFNMEVPGEGIVLVGPVSNIILNSSTVEEVFIEILLQNSVQPNIQKIKDDVTDLVNFEKELSELVESPQRAIDYSETQKMIPSVDFERIFKNLANPTRPWKDTWNKLKSRMRFHDISYFTNTTKNLETVLQSTTKRTLANYLILKLIESTSDFIFPETTKFDECTLLVREFFPLGSLRVFTRNYFDKENLKIASDMVEEIRESMIETFEESKWLQEETKKNAIRKLKMMKKVIGYPEEFEVPGALDEYYKTLKLSEKDSYLMIRVKSYKFLTEHNLDFVAEILSIHPREILLTANAFYHPLHNSLNLFIPFLDDPLFDSTYPKYARIGNIGEVIGHEMGHGFDPERRKYDANGEENDCWTTEDSKEYERRVQCLVEHHDNYDDHDFGKDLKGNATITEIVPDVIGIYNSWKAYKKVDFHAEPSIFGFEDERPEKLFFHLTALNWCQPRVNTPFATQMTRVHPTGSFRVNGIFSNMKEFSEAFNCPIGSPMNPEKKCELF